MSLNKTFIPLLAKLLETITDSFVMGFYAFYIGLYHNINAPGLTVDLRLMTPLMVLNGILKGYGGGF